MDRDSYDSPWKEALVRYLPRFFEFFFPWIFEEVDWSSGVRFADKELQALAPSRPANKRGGARVVDSLVELRRRSGEKALVLVHIEIQAQRVREFEKRMLLYHTRILERQDKPVCSLAILADKGSNWRPERYQQEIWGNRLFFQFPSCKLLDYDDQLSDLEHSANPFGLLTAATLHAQKTTPNSSARDSAKWRMVRGLYRAGLSKKEIRDFFRLIDWVLRLTPKREKIFWKRLEKMEKETKMPFITSVERIGIEKGRRGTILDVLATRFGVVPPNLAKKLEGISDLERLKELSRLAVTAAKLKEFEKEL